MHKIVDGKREGRWGSGVGGGAALLPGLHQGPASTALVVSRVSAVRYLLGFS